jgi:hypothetical protein
MAKYATWRTGALTETDAISIGLNGDEMQLVGRPTQVLRKKHCPVDALQRTVDFQQVNCISEFMSH